LSNRERDRPAALAVSSGREGWRETAEMLARNQDALRKFYASLPQVFEAALAF
jgi:hypothetical protein